MTNTQSQDGGDRHTASVLTTDTFKQVFRAALYDLLTPGGQEEHLGEGVTRQPPSWSMGQVHRLSIGYAGDTEDGAPIYLKEFFGGGKSRAHPGEYVSMTITGAEWFVKRANDRGRDKDSWKFVLKGKTNHGVLELEGGSSSVPVCGLVRQISSFVDENGRLPEGMISIHFTSDTGPSGYTTVYVDVGAEGRQIFSRRSGTWNNSDIQSNEDQPWFTEIPEFLRMLESHGLPCAWPADWEADRTKTTTSSGSSNAALVSYNDFAIALRQVDADGFHGWRRQVEASDLPQVHKGSLLAYGERYQGHRQASIQEQQDMTDQLMSQLGWGAPEGRTYLQETFALQSRSELNDWQMVEFIIRLEDLVTAKENKA